MPLVRESSASRYTGNVSHFHRFPLGHCGPRDVFGSFEIAYDEMPLGRARRRQREATVAHDHGGDAVETRAGPEGVPIHLRVHVGMNVDKARGHDVSGGVDFLSSSLTDDANGGDAALGNAHVGTRPRASRAVDDRRITDDEIHVVDSRLGVHGVIL